MKKRQRKSSVPVVKMPEPISYTLKDLYTDISDLVKKYPNARVHACIGSSGGPMPRVSSTIFYESGIKGKPTFILDTEQPE